MSSDNCGDKPGSGPPSAGSLPGHLPEPGLPHHSICCIPPGCKCLWSSSPLITGVCWGQGPYWLLLQITSSQHWAGNISNDAGSRLHHGLPQALVRPPTHLELLQGDRALSNELVCVLLQHRHLSVDLLVHERLREHGLIHLIVAAPAVTDLQGQWNMGLRPCPSLHNWSTSGRAHALRPLKGPHYHLSLNVPPPSLCTDCPCGTKPFVSSQPRLSKILQTRRAQHSRDRLRPWALAPASPPPPPRPRPPARPRPLALASAPRPTRSTTTSLLKVFLHSAATLHTYITASGSSAFTWKMGALTTRATSVGYGEERAIRGSVVKPICKAGGPGSVCLLRATRVGQGAGGGRGRPLSQGPSGVPRRHVGQEGTPGVAAGSTGKRARSFLLQSFPTAAGGAQVCAPPVTNCTTLAKALTSPEPQCPHL